MKLFNQRFQVQIAESATFQLPTDRPNKYSNYYRGRDAYSTAPLKP